MEVSRINPSRFKYTIPKLFSFLEKGVKSNWLIIKVIKAMHFFIKEEPRVLKKLAKVYNKILLSTRAKSVEIELIREIIVNFNQMDFSELYNCAV